MLCMHFLQQERPLSPERPKINRCTQTEPFLHCVTQYIMEHPATVMLLLGLDPMANMGPVIQPTVEYYDSRSRRPSGLEQIIESENGSQTPSSTTSDRAEPTRSPSGSPAELEQPAQVKKLVDKDKFPNLKRSRHSASDLSDATERLLPAKTQPSSYSLKNNVNS